MHAHVVQCLVQCLQQYPVATPRLPEGQIHRMICACLLRQRYGSDGSAWIPHVARIGFTLLVVAIRATGNAEPLRLIERPCIGFRWKVHRVQHAGLSNFALRSRASPAPRRFQSGPTYRRWSLVADKQHMAYDLFLVPPTSIQADRRPHWQTMRASRHLNAPNADNAAPSDGSRRSPRRAFGRRFRNVDPMRHRSSVAPCLPRQRPFARYRS